MPRSPETAPLAPSVPPKLRLAPGRSASTAASLSSARLTESPVSNTLSCRRLHQESSLAGIHVSKRLHGNHTIFYFKDFEVFSTCGCMQRYDIAFSRLNKRSRHGRNPADITARSVDLVH